MLFALLYFLSIDWRMLPIGGGGSSQQHPYPVISTAVQPPYPMMRHIDSGLPQQMMMMMPPTLQYGMRPVYQMPPMQQVKCNDISGFFYKGSQYQAYNFMIWNKKNSKNYLFWRIKVKLVNLCDQVIGLKTILFSA